ncbi:MAG: 1-deoxy-D-xylulose-5-phosphate reductoisomerase [Chloroflexi bacterium]|nr:1-deoxy-D-xylulose-5-phosphate reductoisomerase [Chloroflexota bacterium]
MDDLLRIAILGSTGSVGRQSLEVARAHPDKVKVIGLAARTNATLLEDQIAEFHPAAACLSSQSEWSSSVEGVEMFHGARGLVELATLHAVDLVVAATSGSEGFQPLIAAIRAGKKIALANKEALVMAGQLVVHEAKAAGCLLRPVDSEHSAIWQCLQGERRQNVEGVTLTASGGPFRTWAAEELAVVTPSQALKHPVWSMGSKITIDSATLMNKGLEVIEAHWLFDLPFSRIRVAIHPQSVIHSLVHFADGSLKAQLGTPDMRLPISYALSWPDRWHTEQPVVDLLQIQPLTFFEPDFERFPLLRLAMTAGELGHTYPTALCAADEVAVNAFLRGEISWTRMHAVIEQTLDQHTQVADPSLEEILAADAEARNVAQSLCRRYSRQAVL